MGVREIPEGSPLWSQRRLRALEHTLINGKSRADRLEDVCKIVSELLDTPIVQVSLVSDAREFCIASHGSRYSQEVPLEYSLCKHVVDMGETLGIDDALLDPVLRENRAVREWNVRSYLGEPIVGPDHAVLGSLCALDYVPRTWREPDFQVLSGMAYMITGVLLAPGDTP